MPDVQVEAVNVVGAVVEVAAPRVVVVEIPSVVGPRGPAGAGAVVFSQATPLATWTVPHTLGRRPIVSVFLGDEEVDADVFATDLTVTVMFPAPTSGSLILV